MVLSKSKLTEIELYKLKRLEKSKVNIEKLLIDAIVNEYDKQFNDCKELNQEEIIYYLYTENIKRGVLIERIDKGGYWILNENGKKIRQSIIYFNMEDAVEGVKRLQASYLMDDDE